MGFNTTRENIEQRMVDNWTATTMAKVEFSNVTFDKPNDEWVRFTVLNGGGVTAEGGIAGSTYKVKDTGLISLQVFVPASTGTKTSSTLIDSFVTIFEHKRFSSIVTYSATVTPGGVRDGWHQTNITIPFRSIRNVGS